MKSKLFVLTVILLLTLSACEYPPTETPTATPTPASAQAEDAPADEAPAPTPTLTPEPETSDVEAPADEAADEEVEVPALSEVEGCVELLEPLDGIELPGNARVTFSWSAHPNADSYLLNFVFPDGLELFFAIDETTTARYMSGFSMHPAYNQSGEHQWNVSALNTAGEELCQSGFFTFTKAISDVAPEESAPQGDGNDGGGGDSGDGWDDDDVDGDG